MTFPMTAIDGQPRPAVGGDRATGCQVYLRHRNGARHLRGARFRPGTTVPRPIRPFAGARYPGRQPRGTIPPSMNAPRWTWTGLVAIWATGVLLWTLAAARGLGEPALHALPFGIAQMGVAALLAVGVWHL